MDQQHPKTVRKPIRAAQYVRMSTEHQQYSTENQSDAIARYAEQHGMEIVVTHADSGKSGLTLAGREELQKLLEEAESGHANFSAVLVYDVSRWGRF
jgi:DNA invertase Pin-like site-specific DNA recombinase